MYYLVGVIMQTYQEIKTYLLGLLSKALHPKKVYVTPKNGKIKPHWKTVYVNDDNLLPKVPTQVYTQSSKTIPQSVRNIANAHQAKFKDKASFLKDLKDRGITWEESSHPAINFMRAKMALNNAIINGTHGFTFTVGAQPPTVPPNPSKPSKSTLSQMAKDKTKDFRKSCKDRADFLDKLKKLGITWTEHSNSNINHMRACVALSKRVEEGFDPQAELKKLDKPAQIISIKNEPHPDSHLAKDMGNTHYKSLRSIVDKVVYDSAKLWSAHENHMRLNISAKNKTCYYERDTRLIYIKSLKSLSKDSVGYKKWGILLHEGGHLIDWHHREYYQFDIFYNGDIRTVDLPLPYSARYKDGAFVKALHSDINRFLSKYNLYGLDNERQALEQEIKHRFDNLDFQWFSDNNFAQKNCKRKDTLLKELLSTVRSNHVLTSKKIPPTEEQIFHAMAVLNLQSKYKTQIKKAVEEITKSDDDSEYMDVSDMLEGVTHGIVRPGWGHGIEYWKSRADSGKEEKLATEAFAEMMSAELSNPTSLEFIKKQLPTAYKVYQEMIQSLCEKESAKRGQSPNP